METGLGSVAKSGGSSAVSLNGLKFDRKIYFEEAATAGAPPNSGTRSSSSGSGKKRGPSPGSQPPRCQVEGCQLNLSDAKAYYSRHKVCAMHSKSPKVIVGGLEQRFCQQCSRFHQLSEFDQGKRSCRRRLAGHNERRRKPAPGTFFPSCYRYACLKHMTTASNSRGGGIMVDFTAYSRIAGRDSWPIPRSKECAPASRNTFTYQWLHNCDNPPPSDVLLQSSASGVGFSSPSIPPGECYTGVTDSSCALSLLSNQPWGSRNKDPAIRVNGPNNADGQPMAQPTVPHAAFINPYSVTRSGFMGNDSRGSSSAMLSNQGSGQFSDGLEPSQQRRTHYMELFQGL